jgi:hypothetical protein
MIYDEMNMLTSESEENFYELHTINDKLLCQTNLN